MTSGIYSIRNIVTNKCYIGQASDFSERKRKHFTALKGNYHYNQYLQHAFNKYGIENFEFIELIKCSEEELDHFEDVFIKLFDTKNHQKGYNIRDGGRFHQSAEMIAKMTKTNQDKVENVLQIDPNTLQIIKVWPSQSSVMKNFPISINVHQSCKDKGRLMGGFYWIWEKDFSPTWKPHIDLHSHPMIAVDEQNIILYIFRNKREAEKALHTDRKNMNGKVIKRDGKKITLLEISHKEYYEYQIGTCIDYPREEE